MLWHNIIYKKSPCVINLYLFGGVKPNKISLGWLVNDIKFNVKERNIVVRDTMIAKKLNFDPNTVQFNTHLVVKDYLPNNLSYAFSDILFTTSTSSTYFLSKIPGQLSSKSDQYIIPSLNNNNKFFPIQFNGDKLRIFAKVLQQALLQQAIIDDNIKMYCAYESPLKPRSFQLNTQQSNILLTNYANSLKKDLSDLYLTIRDDPTGFHRDTAHLWLKAQNYYIEDQYHMLFRNCEFEDI